MTAILPRRRDYVAYERLDGGGERELGHFLAKREEAFNTILDKWPEPAKEGRVYYTSVEFAERHGVVRV